MKLEERIQTLKNQEITHYLLEIIVDKLDYVIGENNYKLKDLKREKNSDTIYLVVYTLKMLFICEMILAAFILFFKYFFMKNIKITSFIGLEGLVIAFVCFMVNGEKSYQNYYKIQKINKQKKLADQYKMNFEEITKFLMNQNEDLVIRKNVILQMINKNEKNLKNIYNEISMPVKYRNIVSMIKFDLYLKEYNNLSIEKLISLYNKEKMSCRFTGKFDLLQDVAKSEKYKQPTIYFYIMRIENLASEYIKIKKKNDYNYDQMFEYEDELRLLINNEVLFEDFILKNIEKVI